MDRELLIKYLNEGMTTKEIGELVNLDKRTVSYWIKKYDLQELLNYKKLPTYRFEKIDTKEKAYTLGFMLSDGSVAKDSTVEISIALRDKEVVEFIAETTNGNVRCDYTLNVKAKRFPRARYKRKIHDIVKFTGGYKKKDRHYPRVRDNLEKFLLQGLFDADGCISWGRRKDKNRIWQKISFTSQLKILKGVQQYLLKKLHISTAIRPKGNEDCYMLDFCNKEDVLKFCDHIYSDNFVILKRKYLKYKALRLELEENGETNRIDCQYRAEPAEQEGVETSGDMATHLNYRNSIQDCA